MSHDIASTTEQESREMFKVVVIDYYASGEGRRVFIKTGSESHIKEEVGDWFYQGAEAFTVQKWLEIDKDTCDSSNDEGSNLETLKMFAPVLWDAMNQGVEMLVDIEYHWNES
ncbi:hypothetical protein L4D20_03420 [Vibrio kyushuensis]|uniref:hypothetical protein n=1 Tax=Vibrio kyushuensis TaxID=2910249 RepID=UPI003D14D611